MIKITHAGVTLGIVESARIEGNTVVTPDLIYANIDPGEITFTEVEDPALAAQRRAALKVKRELSVANIKVTTQAGNTFDGDEESQGRMARAIIALSTGLAPSVNWVLADNTVIAAVAAELTEALVLAGQAQAAIWVIE